MPESATITNFYTFVAGDKARSAEVNTNFSNFRGHSIPIDPNTEAAAGNTYDLGSSEHRWRDYYGESVNLEGSTSTTNPIFQPDTSITEGAMDLLFGSSTVGSWDQYGLKPSTIGPKNFTNIIQTSGSYTIASGVIGILGFSYNTGGGLLNTNTEHTLVGSGSGQFSIMNSINGTPRFSFLNTAFTINATSGFFNFDVTIRLYRTDPATTLVYTLSPQVNINAGTATGANTSIPLYLNGVFVIDNSAPTGEVNYYWSYQGSSSENTDASFTFSGIFTGEIV